MSRWSRVDPANISSLPTVACVYAIYINGNLVYVGQTVNLRARFREHGFEYSYANDVVTPWGRSRDVFAKFSVSPKYGEWAMRELRLIRRLRPRGNSRGLALRRVRLEAA